MMMKKKKKKKKKRKKKKRKMNNNNHLFNHNNRLMQLKMKMLHKLIIAMIKLLKNDVFKKIQRHNTFISYRKKNRNNKKIKKN
jgi:hypothetical protein